VIVTIFHDIFTCKFIFICTCDNSYYLIFCSYPILNQGFKGSVSITLHEKPAKKIAELKSYDHFCADHLFLTCALILERILSEKLLMGAIFMILISDFSGLAYHGRDCVLN
jgi:hypothetical protein